MPVSQRVTCESARAGRKRRPVARAGARHGRTTRRAAPGTAGRSRQPTRAAGSRSLAEVMSSRIRERAPTSVFAQVLVEGGGEVALAVRGVMTTMFLPAASGRRAISRAARWLLPTTCRQVASFAAVSRARRIASSNSTSMTSSMMSRSRIAGTKLGPMPWILWGPGWVALGEHGGGRRLDGDDLDPGDALLEHWPTPVIVPPVPMPATKVVDLAVGVAQDLLGGGLACVVGGRSPRSRTGAP